MCQLSTSLWLNTIRLWSSFGKLCSCLGGSLYNSGCACRSTKGLHPHPVRLFFQQSEGHVRQYQHPWVRLSFCSKLWWMTRFCYRFPDCMQMYRPVLEGGLEQTMHSSCWKMSTLHWSGPIEWLYSHMEKRVFKGFCPHIWLQKTWYSDTDQY